MLLTKPIDFVMLRGEIDMRAGCEQMADERASRRLNSRGFR